MKKTNYIFFVVSPILLLLFVGCGTMRAYEGSPLARDQVAVIKPYPGGGILGMINGGDFFPRSVSVTIHEINGKSSGLYKNVEVQPGIHTVEISYPYILPQNLKFTSITFKTVAGHEYIIGVKSNTIWVEDVSTGKSVTIALP